MSNTYRHKINTKYRLGLIDKVPINIKKYWNRINFDKSYFFSIKIKEERI